jgi:hypothetical protein
MNSVTFDGRRRGPVRTNFKLHPERSSLSPKSHDKAIDPAEGLLIAVCADDAEGRGFSLVHHRGTRKNNRILADPAEAFDLRPPQSATDEKR